MLSTPAAAWSTRDAGRHCRGLYRPALPLLFGFLAEHLSFGWAWVAAALFGWAAAAAMWTGRGMLRRARVSPAPS